MKFRLSKLSVTLLVTALMTGCATQRDVQTLRADVDALRQLTEQASRDASEALQDSRLLRDELAAVRQASESASSDAAATRKMMEQMSDRLGTGSTPSTLK